MNSYSDFFSGNPEGSPGGISVGFPGDIYVLKLLEGFLKLNPG